MAIKLAEMMMNITMSIGVELDSRDENKTCVCNTIEDEGIEFVTLKWVFC